VSVAGRDAAGIPFDIAYDPRPALGPGAKGDWSWRIGGMPWSDMTVTIEHDGLLGGHLSQVYQVHDRHEVRLIDVHIDDGSDSLGNLRR